MNVPASHQMMITAAIGAAANARIQPAETSLHRPKAPLPGKAKVARRQGKSHTLATDLTLLLASGTQPLLGRATLHYRLQL